MKQDIELEAQDLVNALTQMMFQKIFAEKQLMQALKEIEELKKELEKHESKTT